MNKLKQLYLTNIVRDRNLDSPRENEKEYEVLFWSVNQPTKIYNLNYIQNNLVIFNQSEDIKTRMACWCYWMTHLSNAENLCEYKSYWKKYNQLNPKDYWLEFIKDNPESEYVWSYLQDWLDWFEEKWLITWSARLDTIEQAKDAIDNCRLIYTGSLNWDWDMVKNSWIYSIKNKSYWHLFCIIWYTVVWFIAVNSWWPDNWYFIIPYEYWDTLYSKYAISDKRDEEAYNRYNRLYNTIFNFRSVLEYYEFYTEVINKYWIDSQESLITKSIAKKRFLL